MPHLKAKAKKTHAFSYSVPILQHETAFKAKHGRAPATDSEIDEVYGPGEATRAMDKVYRKMKLNERR